MSDLIDRQVAISFVDCGYLRPPTELAWSDKDVVDMLKRVPSAQPETHEERTETRACDCISRQAAIDALNMLFKKQVTQFGYEGYEKADEKTQLVCDGISYSIESVMNLPSAQPQRWIPVSERLPEYGTEVVTINKDDEYEINHVIDEEDGEWFFNGAVAWMPLPEPYKEEER